MARWALTEEPLPRRVVGGRRAAGDVAVQLFGRVGNLAFGVVVTLLLARALGDEGFGQWATLLAIVFFGNAFGELGLETVAVTRAAAARQDEALWVGAVVTLRSVLAVPVVGGSFLVVLLIADSSEMRLAGALLSLTLAFGGLTSSRAVFQLRTRNDITILVLTVNSILWTGAVVLLAATDAGLAGFALAFVLAQAASTSLQFVLAVRTGGVALRGARRYWGELVRVALPVSIAGLMVTAYVRIDQILVFEIAGARDGGLYGAAYRVLDQSQFIPATVMTTLLPMISAAHPGDPARVRRLTQTGGELMAIPSFGALAFALALAEPIMRLLFGEQFIDAAPALPILLGAFVCVAFGFLIGSLRIVLGLQKRFVVYAAIGLVFNVVANLLLIPSYGFLGAAWVTLGTELLVLGLMGRVVLLEMKFRPDLGPFIRIAAAAAVLGLLSVAGHRLEIPLLVLAVLAVPVYAGLLLALRAVRPADIKLLLRRPDAPSAID